MDGLEQILPEKKNKTVECIESSSYTEHFTQLHYNMQQHNMTSRVAAA